MSPKRPLTLLARNNPGLSIVLALGATTSHGIAQTYHGNATLTTQAQVDAFDYTEINGSLRLWSSGITTLEPLSDLRTVNGNLTLDQLAVDSLVGLDALSVVDGSVTVYLCSSLESLEGLTSLAFISGVLRIQGCSRLSTLRGIGRLTEARTVLLNNCTALVDLGALAFLERLDQDLVLAGNASLTSTRGLTGLQFVGGNVRIEDNATLGDFCGLAPLAASGTVGGIWSIWFNQVNPSPSAIALACAGTIVDSDEDGMTNDQEALVGTDPVNPDTDGDGLLDGTEVDMQTASNPTCPDPLVPDSDGDTLLDGAEVALGTSACDPDTDGDGLSDAVDPSPLDDNVTNGVLSETALNLADYIQTRDLGLFDAPNANAQSGRRNSLATHARNAANAIVQGNYTAATSLLEGILARGDGDPIPDDWMVASTDRDTIVLFATGLIGLMSP